MSSQTVGCRNVPVGGRRRPVVGGHGKRDLAPNASEQLLCHQSHIVRRRGSAYDPAMLRRALAFLAACSLVAMGCAESSDDSNTDTTAVETTAAPATTAAPVTTVAPSTTAAPATTPPPATTAAPAATQPADTDPQFDTCGDATDAGYGNYRQGVDPEYDWYDDRDGDGIVCEF